MAFDLGAGTQEEPEPQSLPDIIANFVSQEHEEGTGLEVLEAALEEHLVEDDVLAPIEEENLEQEETETRGILITAGSAAGAT